MDEFGAVIIALVDVTKIPNKICAHVYMEETTQLDNTAVKTRILGGLKRGIHSTVYVASFYLSFLSFFSH